MSRNPSMALWALVVMIILLCVLAWREARSQDGHSENHDWYKNLRGLGGGSCCSGDEVRGDCRIAQARQNDDGFWEVWLRDHWQVVPPNTFLPDWKNEQPLHSHVCEREGYIFCFLKGAAGG